MKNYTKISSFNMILVLIGFLSIACGDVQQPISTSGRLTINGLDAYIGIETFSAIADVGGDKLIAIKEAFSQKGGGDFDVFEEAKITGPSLTVKVYRYSFNPQRFRNYNGNDKNVVFALFPGTNSGTVTVDFTNGVGEGEFILD